MSGERMKCPKCGGSGNIEFDPVLVVALNLTAARAAKGWTQEELAVKSGMSRPQLANMETGRSATTVGNLVCLADALGVTVDELVRYREES